MQARPSGAPLDVRMFEAVCTMPRQSPQIGRGQDRLPKNRATGGGRGCRFPQCGRCGLRWGPARLILCLSRNQGSLPLAILAGYGLGMDMMNRFRVLSVLCAAVAMAAAGAHGALAQNWGWGEDGSYRAPPDQRPPYDAPGYGQRPVYGQPGYGQPGSGPQHRLPATLPLADRSVRAAMSLSCN